jgi:hypothetical protein
VISVETLADLGVTPNQSSQWQRIAEVPEPKFEKIVESDDPSRAAVLKEAPKPARKPRTQKPAPFHEEGVLAVLRNELGESIEKHWPKNRDFAPIVHMLRSYADYLEQIQGKRK